MTNTMRRLGLPVLMLLLGLAGINRAQAQDVVYYHTDALGTPVVMTDSSGNVITGSRREFEPYGRQLSPTPVADGPGYTGHVSDAATGLDYMQQRYYDPLCGCFLSVDPVAVDKVGGNFNRYWYAINNPYRFKDLDGRQSYEDLNFSGQMADQLLRDGKITPEQHMEMWNSGAMASGKGLFLGLAIADGAALVRGGLGGLASLRSARNIAREFSVNSTQLGKKLGAHVADFGGNPANAADRAVVARLINDIGRNPTQVVSGLWRGLGEGGKIGQAEFRIKGSDVVVTTPKGEFVTILKNGIENKFVQAAINSLN
jgi:RHS repeat-associated protein